MSHPSTSRGSAYYPVFPITAQAVTHQNTSFPRGTRGRSVPSSRCRPISPSSGGRLVSSLPRARPRTAPHPRSNHAPAAGFAGCAALETASPRAHQSPTAASPAAHCAERFPCPGCSCAEGGALKPAMPMEFRKKKRKKRHQSSSGQKPELDFIKQSQYHHKHLQARATSPASLFPSSCFFPAPEARIQQNAPAPATSARPFPGQSQAGPTDTTTVGFSTPGK